MVRVRSGLKLELGLGLRAGVGLPLTLPSPWVGRDCDGV